MITLHLQRDSSDPDPPIAFDPTVTHFGGYGMRITPMAGHQSAAIWCWCGEDPHFMTVTIAPVSAP